MEGKQAGRHWLHSAVALIRHEWLQTCFCLAITAAAFFALALCRITLTPVPACSNNNGTLELKELMALLRDVAGLPYAEAGLVQVGHRPCQR